jgi:hypothetical protein
MKSGEEGRMELVCNCLKVHGGIIALVRAVEPEKAKSLSTDHISISVKSYGLDVLLDDAVIIPIPEFMLGFFLENSTIWIYHTDEMEYLWEPFLTIEIPKEEIIEAKGAYKFIQSGSGQGGVAV